MHSSSRPRPLMIMSWLLLSLAFLSGCGKDETAAVQKSWDDFFAAAQAKDSQKAVGLISQSTIDYYERIRKAALEADEPEVRAMKAGDKVMVLQLRIRMAPAYLRTLTGAQVFMVSVQEGWDAKQRATTPEMSNIKVDGDRATGTMVVNGKDAPFDYVFLKEDGIWKHDLTAMLDLLSDMASQAMRAGPANIQQKDFDAGLLMGLQIQTGKEVSPDIWKKPKE